MTQNENRVVISGIGVLSALGDGLEALKQALKEGVSGVRHISYFDTSEYKYDKAAVLPHVPEEFDTYGEIEDANKFARYCLAQALKDAAIDLSTYAPERIGISMASSNAGENTREYYLKEHVLKGDFENRIAIETPATMVGVIAEQIGSEGPRVSISTACAAGGNSIGCAYDMIMHGECDVVISGGVDPLSKLSYSGFLILNTIAPDTIMPFDEHRNGIELGEAGVVFVVEKLEYALKRNAKIYAEVVGYGISNDAYHTSSPDPEASGAIAAMQQCMGQGGVQPEDVDYINAHGTGTHYNDEMELLAITRALGKETAMNIAISSTKSMHGHSLAAAGSLELAVCIVAMCDDFVPMTINTTEIMSEYKDYNIVTRHNSEAYVGKEIDLALSNSFGFAGNNTCLGIRKYLP